MENCNKSKSIIKQEIKSKKGPKPGERIEGIIKEREKMEKFFLEMFLEGNMGVDPQRGTANLVRFIADLGILLAKNGKPLSANTIKEDFTEIKKEMLYDASNKKTSKLSNLK